LLRPWWYRTAANSPSIRHRKTLDDGSTGERLTSTVSDRDRTSASSANVSARPARQPQKLILDSPQPRVQDVETQLQASLERLRLGFEGLLLGHCHRPGGHKGHTRGDAAEDRDPAIMTAVPMRRPATVTGT
jgi:hypothetical protein